MEISQLKNLKTIILVTDTYSDTNGVSTTVKNYEKHIPNIGYDLIVLHPSDLPYFRCPFSNDVKLAFNLQFEKKYFEKPFAIHIVTEGTLGLQARNFCLKNSFKFTTSYLTMFPEYLKQHIKLPIWLTRKYFNWFHNKAEKVFCCTKDLANKLDWIKTKKYICPKGVDTSLFKMKIKESNSKKTALYVGRVSKEKNIEAFCDLHIPTQKTVVGDGPQLEELKIKYPNVNFVGKIGHENLVDYYQKADVFVFPSKTDTYGLVMLEALSCGTPVASYPINGGLDLADNNTVFVDEDLNVAVMNAFDHADRSLVSYKNKMYGKSWEESVESLCSELIFNQF